ncbi:RagB/SusD family nutrient uptake outer membrane protein [Massilibacteroides sp.]|uniref:RagB/SusD family nutrient uptake outer membrane protein n=1 Tax=Massilibacteroides sp. TaxID=2034766 RepID=UPI00263739B4|nr:RagB/SusD family nutrient uptake outer membrane protein [Massilibacteroides sp.]MDD4515885.1 RagB/SusD family nutrient uptake outer membrane protein [Massilibacteroides sp.]
MKKKYLYIIVFPLLLGCTDVLNTIPTDRLSSEVYWKTDQDAEYAANAIYRFLESPGTLIGRDIMTDMARATFETSDETKVETSIADPQTNIFQNTWNDLYKGIRRCNDYLENVEKIVPTDVNKVNRITSEVRTLRCYFYARLVAYFGEIPLVKTPIGISESKTLTRTPVPEIYDFIYTEITEAASFLPDKATEIGRVTKGAALGILARTMLFASGNVTNTDNRTELYLQRAKEAADAVIDLKAYSLLPKYQELFTYSNENNIEIILDHQYMKDIYANAVMNNFGAVSLGNNGSMLSPTKKLVDEYETKNGKTITEDNSYDPKDPYNNRDPRLSYTLYYPGSLLPNGTTYDSRPGWSTSADVIGASYQVSKTGLLPKKYINTEDIGQSNRSNCGINLIILRYAEILLIAAESRIELNTELDVALSYINQIRQRSDVSMPTLSIVAQKELREAVRHERTVELALEGHRFFDIKRWKIAEDVCNMDKVDGIQYIDKNSGELTTVTTDYKKKFTSRDYLWPIPYNERQLNTNLTQNNGWD